MYIHIYMHIILLIAMMSYLSYSLCIMIVITIIIIISATQKDFFLFLKLVELRELYPPCFDFARRSPAYIMLYYSML